MLGDVKVSFIQIRVFEFSLEKKNRKGKDGDLGFEEKPNEIEKKQRSANCPIY